MTRFTSRSGQHRSEHSIRRCSPPRAQTAYAKGRRGRLPSPAGLGNQGLVQQGQPEVRGVPKHTVTLSPRRMPDALVGILLQKKST